MNRLYFVTFSNFFDWRKEPANADRVKIIHGFVTPNLLPEVRERGDAREIFKQEVKEKHNDGPGKRIVIADEVQDRMPDSILMMITKKSIG